MKLKIFAGKTATGFRVVLSWACVLAAVAMIVFGRVVFSRDWELSMYAIPVLLTVAAATLAPQSQRVRRDRALAGKRISNGLAALSSAAILSVYAAGFDQTSDAADQFARQAATARRRPESIATVPQQAFAPETTPAATFEEGQSASLRAPEPADKPGVVSSDTLAGTASEDPVSVNVLPTPAAPASPAAATAASVDVASAAPALPAEAIAVDAPVAEQQPPNNEFAYEYADGTFKGRGTSRHGDVEVQVVIEGGRIVSARVSRCMTQYSCDVMRPPSRQLVEIQDPDKIDNVTGATHSIDAYYWGIVQALESSWAVKIYQNRSKTTP